MSNQESKETVYQQQGYKDRADYLESLEKEYNIPEGFLGAMSDVLGECEDFDGLVSSAQDYENMFGGE